MDIDWDEQNAINLTFDNQSIDIEDDNNDGTTFRVILPLSEQNPAD
ncbi:hypothetical protein [Gracilibacillus orientalis]|nr:hypothetical protein [Gracilibacillus orientalis]